jgi:GTPase SAR1 family protein
MSFGQFVIGPPGSGKSTYCNGMQQFLTAIGRDVAIVNLDPANENVPYQCAVDIADLISLEDVMNSEELGPNGGLIFCLEYLEQNIDWLKEQLEPLKKKYILFDLPGQVELYTHHDSLRKIADIMTKSWGYRLAAVHLVDAHHVTDAAKFISVLLVSLSGMLHLEMPHVNILSKVDLIEQYGRLQFDLINYTDVVDISSLLVSLNANPFMAQFAKLNQELVELIEGFNLVNFQVLAIEDKESVAQVVKLVDTAIGYIFTGMDVQWSAFDEKTPTIGALAQFEFEREHHVHDIQVLYPSVCLSNVFLTVCLFVALLLLMMRMMMFARSATRSRGSTPTSTALNSRVPATNPTLHQTRWGRARWLPLIVFPFSSNFPISNPNNSSDVSRPD